MLSGKYQGADVGSGTAGVALEEDLLAGRMTEEKCAFAEGCMARSNGHCMTMGTASTMASMAEGPWHAAALLGELARRRRPALRDGPAAGQVIVDLVENDVTPDPDHDQGGVRERDQGERGDRRVNQRGHPPPRHRGPSRRPLALDDFDTLIRDVPTLVNLQPSGKVT